MRLLALGSLVLLVLQQHVAVADATGGSGGLQPPTLAPLINRANVLLSSGHFGEAAKVYSEAIEQAPSDYLLYYKRATAYLSLQRHQAALDDFDKVLSLTSNTFDNAHLMKARIYLRDGLFKEARHSLSLYLKAKHTIREKEKEVEELEGEINEGEKLVKKTEKERKSQLWTACVDSSSAALRIASHSAELRVWRAECALGAGDVESSVADLSRLANLLQPSTRLLSHTARLSYFLAPPSPVAMNTLKQCLHFDPDSKPCLKLHRLVKAFDKNFKSLEELQAKEDWKGIIKLVTPTSVTGAAAKKSNVFSRWDDAMKDALEKDGVLPLVPDELVHSSSSSKGKMPAVPLPQYLKASPQRQTLVRALCVAYTHMADVVKSSEEYKKQRSQWCNELLTLDGCAEDVAGLVGKAEGLMSEQEYEEAVRLFDKAFEAGGRSDAKVQNRLHTAHRLLKQSKQKDYYKIIGVSRDADDVTIKKAYRKAAKLAHPDKGGSEAKMAALNEAYEVLSNKELRHRFDMGEDPMDPMAQQGGNPWGHPGGPFGGGGGGGHPFAQFFQQQQGGPQFFQQGGRGGGQGGFNFHYSHGH